MTLALLWPLVSAQAGSVFDIRQALEQGGASQVQEKVYIHTDNQCYFVGDTLWYKAYVVRADNLQPTDMSRLLYVELLSPDGLLVERQTIVVSGKGYTCGQFALRDSLYSGYYELRAYTRWMLNFNVHPHYYRTDETWWFYSKQMAADYYRVWDGLYSRVLPIYSKPDTPGDYDARRMYQRPKTRVPRQKKDELIVTFYPEGGNLVEGVENRVAFEACDQNGEAVSIKGKLAFADGTSTDIKTGYMGRGTFLVTPGMRPAKAQFKFRNKDYSFTLPNAKDRGATVRLEGSSLTIVAAGLMPTNDFAISVTCRGKLYYFKQLPELSQGSSAVTIDIPFDQLPTGVCDLTLFNDEGAILADRLFFVNHHDHDGDLVTAEIEKNNTYSPYQRIEVPVQLHGVNQPTVFSLAVHDTYTDEPTYNDGNLMTDLLLSSDLRGFIAYPSHYFEADDSLHRSHLDLLMMVQGWRRYKWEELAEAERPMRYQPEHTLTLEGSVYKMLGIIPVGDLPGNPPPGIEEITDWQFGRYCSSKVTDEQSETDDPFSGEATAQDASVETTTTTVYSDLSDANAILGVNHGNLRHEVLVEAEIAVDGKFVGGTQKTQNGHFLFEVPPFYGDAFLNIKAYKENDSIKKNMASRKDAKIYDEDAFPDYYVKRDVFFPIFTHDYTYYEKHQPDWTEEMLIDTLSEWSMENDVHQLGNINVKGHRRGRRAVDWNKPAFVMDAYELYNDITDRGLSFGKLDMRQFPVQVCKYLFGNMNRSISYNVDGRLEGHTYYRNYSPFVSNEEAERSGFFTANRTAYYLSRQLKLKRLQNIRVYTDYEPRTEDSLMVYESHSPDVTVDLQLIPDEGVQPSYRDRHILFHGINMAEDFYHPDYSQRAAGDAPADYRRTLYWNPNAVTDEQGRFNAVFYNNGKETRIRMTAAGVTPDGRLLHSK